MRTQVWGRNGMMKDLVENGEAEKLVKEGKAKKISIQAVMFN